MPLPSRARGLGAGRPVHRGDAERRELCRSQIDHRQGIEGPGRLQASRTRRRVERHRARQVVARAADQPGVECLVKVAHPIARRARDCTWDAIGPSGGSVAAVRVGPHEPLPRAPQKAVERGSIAPDDRGDVAPVQALDGGSDERGPFKPAQ